MDYIADLHIHSPYSRATSPESTLTGLAAWARVKGIQVVGTGDFTHPGWFRRLQEELEPAEPGFFRLKDESPRSVLPGVAPSAAPVRFLLSAEISSIYKRGGRVRKVHNLIYLPDLDAAGRLNARLAAIGNIESDGRPILGLDSRDLLEIVLETAPEGFLVPAHIWTPWFSLFGSKSGFDDIEECFGDLAGEIFALETGLSSDPEMNRLVSALDRFALISNSDCHSPGKLGREANLLSTSFDFFALRDALRANRRDRFRGTVEFFPEEGKYHFDGHRKCDVCLDPRETRRLEERCPVCGGALTIGVHHRVMELADRDAPLFVENAPDVFSLIPLPEVLGEIVGSGPASKAVTALYARTVNRFGSEFGLLLDTPIDAIIDFSPLLGEAVARIRSGRVIRQPGYDGEFGVIRVFEAGERDRLAGQDELFADASPRRGRKPAAAPRTVQPLPAKPKMSEKTAAPDSAPNPEQAAALAAEGRAILVSAGPGTGKTHTLVARLSRLLADPATDPTRVWAITFTNRAADEVRERLLRSAAPGAERVFIGTFHRFCLEWLRRDRPELTVLSPESRERMLRRLFADHGSARRAELSREIEHWHHRDTGAGGTAPEAIARYRAELERFEAIDLDGLVPALLQALGTNAALRRQIEEEVQHLFVDEFQDLDAFQYALVERLAPTARIFAIGDPDQAIYGFRGSRPEFFRRFAKRPGTVGIALRRNYRSAPEIIAAAGAVIARNSDRGDSPLVACEPTGGEIELHPAATLDAEADAVAGRIEELVGGTSHLALQRGRGGDGSGECGFGDIAVLYRLGRQAEPLAEALARRGIPCQRIGATPFYRRAALRPLYGLLQAAAGSRQLADWLDLATTLPGVGSATLERLEAELPLVGDFLAGLARLDLTPALARKLQKTGEEATLFAAAAPQDGVATALAAAMGRFGFDRQSEDAERLLNLAAAFGRDLAGFAAHLQRHAAATVYDERAEAVALMSLHAAKGLEFPVVFIAGCEEGLLPCTLWNDTDTMSGGGTTVAEEFSERALEEERRLFYVGLTRARRRLVLTAAGRRPWGDGGLRPLSRFVGEIPPELLRTVSRKGRPTPTRTAQLELF